jgi:hydrogenase nickel incorporation protein HypB
MCDHCGCDSGARVTTINLQTGKSTLLHAHSPEHAHAIGVPHSHEHTAHGHHTHGHGHHDHHHGSTHVIELNARVQAKNDALATANRAWLLERNILALNLMSAPGAGKTTLLERTLRDLKAAAPLYVVEGDQATANDGMRVRNAGAIVVQVNTGTGCHLDAHMVAHGLEELDPPAGAIVFIENVGNLVCPALFDLGERRKVAILSVTEGDDKPLKYPHMFQEADLVLLNKIDLLPYVDFDVERAAAHARDVNPDVSIMTLSTRTGEGLAAWYNWLQNERATLVPTSAG